MLTEKAMLRVMKYCVQTPNRGWTLKPTRKWTQCNKAFAFLITGRSDSNYATCPETRKSITGFLVRLENAIVAAKSGMQTYLLLKLK